MTKKPTVTTLASGFNSTETLNANFEALRDGFDNTLSLDGSLPNAMEADLDLNGNDIINASVIGTSSLVVNGKLISVSADPVFDGTVSVFGANLIADVDAAAVKTTLGLSTVASTGSYNDLSNQPSLNFASTAQGALADSALQVGDSLDAGNLVNALPAIDGSNLTGITTVTPTSGTAPYYGCRAWGKVSGDALVDGGNFASWNDGWDTVTFTTAMPHANYAVSMNGPSYGNCWASSITTTGFVVNQRSSGGNFSNPTNFEFMVIC